VLARLCTIVLTATILNGLADAGVGMTWLNVCWALVVVLLMAQIWLRRAPWALGLAGLAVDSCALLLLGHIALRMPDRSPGMGTPIAQVTLALAFATTLTSAIVRLGLLLDGRRAIVQLTDA
jgi:hypothetical protein